MANDLDYGKAMSQLGLTAETPVSFSPFTLIHVSLLGNDTFTTAVEVPINGVAHVMAVDFNADMFGRMLAASASDEIAQSVFSWLEAPTGATIVLPEPLLFDVVVTLGEAVVEEGEESIPMIVRNVLPSGALSEGTEIVFEVEEVSNNEHSAH